MNLSTKKSLWLMHQEHKCRCCLKHFNRNEIQAKITKTIKKQFMELTQIVVTIINNISTYLNISNY